MRTLIVIPARYGSTRLPGKPLAQIAGRTMLERVVDTASRAAALAGAGAGSGPVAAEVVVATDDDRIASHCSAIGARWVMTSPEAPSGTDRALLAVEALKEREGGREPDFVVNLQGDAPFTPPGHVAAVIEAARRVEADVVTPVERLSWAELDALRAHKQTSPFSGTTCIRREDGRALWFSKSILPAIRKEAALRAASGEDGASPVWRHVGLYGYRLDALRRFAAWPEGHYEALEGLEQLRFLENGAVIHAVEAPRPALALSGIDTEADLALAEKLIAERGDPHVTGVF